MKVDDFDVLALGSVITKKQLRHDNKSPEKLRDDIFFLFSIFSLILFFYPTSALEYRADENEWILKNRRSGTHKKKSPTSTIELRLFCFEQKRRVTKKTWKTFNIINIRVQQFRVRPCTFESFWYFGRPKQRPAVLRMEWKNAIM